MIPVGEARLRGGTGRLRRLRSEGKSYLKQQTLSDLESSLDAARFVRIHRSYLLNLDRLARIDTEGGEPKGGRAPRRHAPAALSLGLRPAQGPALGGLRGGDRAHTAGCFGRLGAPVGYSPWSEAPMDQDPRPAPSSTCSGNFVTRRIAGETIVVPIRARGGPARLRLRLQRGRGAIWKLLEAEAARGAIVATLAAEFEVDRRAVASRLSSTSSGCCARRGSSSGAPADERRGLGYTEFSEPSARAGGGQRGSRST